MALNYKKASKIVEKAKRSKKNPRKALQINGFSISEIEEYFKDKPKSKAKDEVEEIKYDESKDSAVLESKGRIKTVDELIKEAKVDLNIWAIDRFIINKWECAAKDSNKKLQVEPLWQVKVWLKKKASADAAKELIQWFKEEVKDSTPANLWEYTKLVDKNDTPYCLELAIPDLHLGKLVWGDETAGASYDSNEAVIIFKKAVADLIDKAPMEKVDRILFVIGNDFYNVDGENQTTTAGTPQSEDSRWQNTFKKGYKLLKETITSLAESHHVDCLLIQGNHDYERSFYLGECLSAFFADHPNVIIDNSPTLRKYYCYGNTLIGFTHGDKEVRKQLPLIMAVEQKENWSKTEFKEFHLGHLHKEGDEEIMGVKLRTISSLCSADAWHTSKGYVGQTRSAKAFLYHKDRGLEAQLYFNLQN